MPKVWFTWCFGGFERMWISLKYFCFAITFAVGFKNYFIVEGQVKHSSFLAHCHPQNGFREN